MGRCCSTPHQRSALLGAESTRILIFRNPRGSFVSLLQRIPPVLNPRPKNRNRFLFLGRFLVWGQFLFLGQGFMRGGLGFKSARSRRVIASSRIFRAEVWFYFENSTPSSYTESCREFPPTLSRGSYAWGAMTQDAWTRGIGR